MSVVFNNSSSDKLPNANNAKTSPESLYTFRLVERYLINLFERVLRISSPTSKPYASLISLNLSMFIKANFGFINFLISSNNLCLFGKEVKSSVNCS